MPALLRSLVHQHHMGLRAWISTNRKTFDFPVMSTTLRNSFMKMCSRHYDLATNIEGVKGENRFLKVSRNEIMPPAPIGEGNIGHKLKMGWKGTGLGAEEEGRIDPVEIKARKGRSGLGL
jgi:hypothetical protein